MVIQKSTREGFGLTVSEALWKARPFIGGQVGGIPLQVQDGETGYLVRSPEECAERALKLLREPDHAKQLGRGGKEHVRKHFLTPRLLRDWLRIFRDEPMNLVLVSNRGPASVHARGRRRAGRTAQRRGPGHRADGPRAPPRRALGGVRDDRGGRGGEPRARRPGLHLRGRGDGLQRPPRRVGSRRLRPLLQRDREPDAVVHPALPLGPLERPRHPPLGGRVLRGGLPGRERGPRPRRPRGGRGRGGDRRDAPRLPPLPGAEVHPQGAAGRLPAPLRPHPLDAARRLAGAAARHARGHLRGHPRQRHRRLPHPGLQAQLPALLPGPVRPRRRRGGRDRPLRRPRRMGPGLPASDLGGVLPADAQRPEVHDTSARSCAAAAST